MADQALSALSNAATIVLGAILLESTGEAGTMMLAVTIVMLFVSVNRAFVGDVLLVQAARRDGAERAALTQDAAVTSLCLGLVASAGLTTLWSVAPERLGLSSLIWAAPALPLILLQDTGRYASLAIGKPQRALLLDSAWVVVQAAALGVVAAAGQFSAGVLLVAWGAGAVVGAVVWLFVQRVRVRDGNVGRWISSTRGVSTWFTGTSLLGQLQVQIVAFTVTAALGPGQFAMLRLVQTIVLSPAQNLMMAATGLLVPRASGFAARGAIDRVTRQTRVVARYLALLAIPCVAVVGTVGSQALIEFFPAYGDAAPLMLPVGLQAAVYLVQIPYGAALRGLERGRALFLQGAVMCGSIAVGSYLGLRLGGLHGAAWGICAATAVGFFAMLLSYRRAIGSLTYSLPAS